MYYDELTTTIIFYHGKNTIKFVKGMVDFNKYFS